MSLAVVDFTDLWCGVGLGSPTFCVGHTEQLLEKHHNLRFDAKNLSDDHSFFFFSSLENQMKAVKQRDESVSDIIEIRPHLPDEISAFFPAEMLQTQIHD